MGATTYWSFYFCNQHYPGFYKKAIWNAVPYESLQKYITHQFLLASFLMASDWGLLPRNKSDANPVVTDRGMTFASSLGVSGLTPEGAGIDGIFDLIGSHGTVVVGPCTPDRHQPTRYLDMSSDSIKPCDATPSFSEVACKLLRREQWIADGKLKADARNLLGVTIRPNTQTLDSIPYLVHSDYVKGVRDLAGLADFLTLDLSANTE